MCSDVDGPLLEAAGEQYEKMRKLCEKTGHIAVLQHTACCVVLWFGAGTDVTSEAK